MNTIKEETTSTASESSHPANLVQPHDGRFKRELCVANAGTIIVAQFVGLNVRRACVTDTESKIEFEEDGFHDGINAIVAGQHPGPDWLAARREWGWPPSHDVSNSFQAITEAGSQALDLFHPFGFPEGFQWVDPSDVWFDAFSAIHDPDADSGANPFLSVCPVITEQVRAYVGSRWADVCDLALMLASPGGIDGGDVPDEPTGLPEIQIH